jgi:hypothetical protein
MKPRNAPLGNPTELPPTCIVRFPAWNVEHNEERVPASIKWQKAPMVNLPTSEAQQIEPRHD